MIFSKYSYKISHLSVSVLLFMNLGIRFFDGYTYFFSVILFVLNYSNIRYLNTKILKRYVCFITIFSVLWGVKRNDLYFPMILSYTSCFLVMLQFRYSPKVFWIILSNVLKWCVYYTIAGFIANIIFRNYMVSTSFPMNPQTIFGIFWYYRTEYFPGIYRFQGLGWEPGIWQIMLNIYLFLQIMKGDKLNRIVLTVIAIFILFSTNGYFLLVINIFIYFIYGSFKSLQKIVVVSTFCILLGGHFLSNISAKLDTSSTLSGAARFRDLYIAYNSLTKSPFFGENLENAITDRGVASLLYEYSNLTNHDASILLDVSYSNGLVILLIDAGLILFGFILYFYYNSKLFPSHHFALFYMIIIFVTLFGEPFSRTSFFMLPIIYSCISGRLRKCSYG